jgi:hypothetical protein
MAECVAFIGGGIVDEERRRAEGGDRLGHDAADGFRLREVRHNDRGSAALGIDRGSKRIAFSARTVDVNRHRPAIRGEVLDDGAADPARPARDDGDV